MITLNRSYLSHEQIVFCEQHNIQLGDKGLKLNTHKSNCLKIVIGDEEVDIYYSQLCELYRGIALLKTNIKRGDKIKQSRCFDSLAAFYDCSRNAVLHINMIKRFVIDIAALGFNQLYLYTEDTFEIPEFKYFGHLRGRYTAEEIKQADDFAKLYGVELIPAVQTLAHLDTIFKWNCFSNIGRWGSLYCDNEKTYDFLDKMFASLRNMYSTDKINIGMDEAHGLGADGMRIFLKHIDRVVKIAEKYGFKPIMWSDMFFKLAAGKLDFDDLKSAEFDEQTLELIPDDVTLAYWNYSPNTEEYYDTMLKSHLAMGKKIIFTGGFEKWIGFCPNFEYGVKASKTALKSCVKNNIRDVIITGWGDNGAEASIYTMLPGLVIYAEQCYTNDISNEHIDEILKSIFGYGFEDFKTMELPNRMPGNDNDLKKLGFNTNKVVLWNDPLTGPYDKHIKTGFNEIYSQIAEKYSALKNKNNRLSYVFETLYCLCDFLALKAEIGNQLHNAYISGNKETLRVLLEKVPVMINKLDVFHSTFRNNWSKENKMLGFDVQDIRFGALRARLCYLQEALSNYLDNQISRIEELECERLFIDCRLDENDTTLNLTIREWSKVATFNPLQ